MHTIKLTFLNNIQKILKLNRKYSVNVDRKECTLMGLSASQARLLSITGRLTNNEFRAQTITNAKLRLAKKSQEASDAYLEALGSKELMFMTYDGNGENTKVNLTPASLYDYAPMKNQYLIQNSNGKFLLSNTDIKNFEETGDLFKFLKCYDLSYDVTDTVNEKIKADWQAKRDKLYEDYLKRHAEWDEIKKNWDGTKVHDEIYKKFYSVVGDSRNPLSCYRAGLRKEDAGCYLHLLNHLLDYDGGQYRDNGIDQLPCAFKTYKTSTKDEFTPTGYAGSLGGTALYNNITGRDTLRQLSEDIADENNKCDAADEFIPWYENPDVSKRTEYNDVLLMKEDNILQRKIDNGDTITKYDILKSDYIYDADTNSVTGVKSLRQKLIDLYYIISCIHDDSKLQPNSYGGKIVDPDMPSPDDIRKDMYEMLRNFTEGDLKFRTKSDPPKEPEWKEPDPPKLVEGLAFLRDQEKSQWYTNLWHAMNGSDTSNTVDPINFDNDVDYLDKIPDDIRSEYRFIVENKTKDTKQTNYTEIDKNLEGSAEWLEFALEHGIVSLVQAQYYNPDEDSNKTANLTADGFKWNNIVYTSARDIVSQEDQQAIAIAEITYKNTLQEIENEDKKHDQDLKRLDAEHTALQTEYESIKEVISKNTDRSFKAFS